MSLGLLTLIMPSCIGGPYSVSMIKHARQMPYLSIAFPVLYFYCNHSHISRDSRLDYYFKYICLKANTTYFIKMIIKVTWFIILVNIYAIGIQCYCTIPTTTISRSFILSSYVSTWHLFHLHGNLRCVFIGH